MKLSELISLVGDENIKVERLADAIEDAQQCKGYVQLRIGTRGVSLAEIATGQYLNLGLIIWLPMDKLPKVGQPAHDLARRHAEGVEATRRTNE